MLGATDLAISVDMGRSVPVWVIGYGIILIPRCLFKNRLIERERYIGSLAVHPDSLGFVLFLLEFFGIQLLLVCLLLVS